MKKSKISALLVACLMVAASCNNDNNDDVMVPDADRTFAMSAADGGMLEVKLGQLAQDKAMNQSLKNYGQMMVTDHTKANNELKGIADSKDITIPSMLSSAKQQKYDSLAAMQGMKFDSAYVRTMVTSHKETVDMFQKQANTGSDNDLKSFAERTLPTLNMHLTRIQTLQDSLNITP